MVKAASFPEAHEQRYLLSNYPAVYLETHITNLIADFRDASASYHLDGGQALFAEYGEGVALTHAHPVDQWQIYLSGSAQLAKKHVHPITIQYTDAWVPYGPIQVSKEGFALLALWPRPNQETYEMPKDAKLIREKLRGKPHRMLLEELRTSAESPRSVSQQSVIEAGDIWARRWQLPPNATLDTPVASTSGGQFFIPLEGSLVYQAHEYPRWSTIYVGAGDAPITLGAGAGGAEILGTQFSSQ